MIIKTTIVPKQPPPNLLAPYPDIKPLNKLFILTFYLLNDKNRYKPYQRSVVFSKRILHNFENVLHHSHIREGKKIRN
jgi:hypothetical protein